MAMYAPNQLHAVPLAELQPDPTQPRKYLDPLALEEASSRPKFIIPFQIRKYARTGTIKA